MAEVEEATPQQALDAARHYAHKAADEDSAEHVAWMLETALIWVRGAL